jgi:hypothetical protein
MLAGSMILTMDIRKVVYSRDLGGKDQTSRFAHAGDWRYKKEPDVEDQDFLPHSSNPE